MSSSLSGESRTFEVTDADTAVALGSGDVDVLGTPRLLAWMEAVTVTASAPYLSAGQTSVGVSVRLRHRRPTRVGGTVSVDARATEETVEGERLTFAVTATDQSGEVVASGEITRAIVSRSDFS